MTAGYELTEPEPTPANMLDVAHYPHVIILHIFTFSLFARPNEGFDFDVILSRLGHFMSIRIPFGLGSYIFA